MKKELRVLETNQQIHFYFLGYRQDGTRLYLTLPRYIHGTWLIGEFYDEQLANVASWYDWLPLNERPIERLLESFKKHLSETWLTDEEIVRLIYLHYECYYQAFYLEYVSFIQKFGICVSEVEKEEKDLQNLAKQIAAVFDNKIKDKK